MNAFLNESLKAYYNYQCHGPKFYSGLAQAAAHGGEFLDICEKLPPHRLRFPLMVDALATMVTERRANLADIFRAQRLGKTRLDRQDMHLKDYTKLVTHQDIIAAFSQDHPALDFFLGLSSLEVEDGFDPQASRGMLNPDESKHNQIIESLLTSARAEARNEDIKSLMKEKITPFFSNAIVIRQAAKSVHAKLCHENCCDGHRERLQQLAYV